MSIFKACDIRGVYPDQLDSETARRVGRALGAEMTGLSCLLGGDVRPSTPELKAAVAEGLVASGVRVTDVGHAPTPALHWARAHLEMEAVVIITASHNPPEYNGIKFAFGERPPTPEVVDRIERRVEEEDFVDARGKLQEREIRDDYLGWLARHFDGKGTGMRVLIDAGNGAAAGWAAPAFRSVGCEVEELHCTPDGTFPERSPNPAVPEALRDTCRVVAERGVDFGVAFDGDGDRAVFVDETGQYVESDQSVILLARNALRRQPGGTVIYDQKCSQHVGQEITRAGGRPVRERSGYAFIKNRLLDEGAIFAGEASGHFFFREVGGDDAIYAGLRMAAILQEAGEPLSTLLNTIPDYHISPDIRLPRPAGDAQTVIEHLKDCFSERPQDYTDGVRIQFDDGWALCRESVTEPVITLRFEGDTPEALERIKGRVMDEIPEP